MITVSSLRDRVRLELGDQPTPFQTSIAADGITTTFDLPAKPIVPGQVTITGMSADSPPIIYTYGSDFSVNTTSGLVTFVQPPPNGVVLHISGQSYRYFEDADIDKFSETAITQHLYSRSTDSGQAVTLTDLDPVEEYPLVILATIQALYALATDASFDIDIIAPDGVTIPRSQRFVQLMQMIAERQLQYDNLAKALNIGINKIAVFRQRRVSRTTGRYVPVYQEKEVEDSRPSRRLFLPPNLYGEPGEETTQAVQVINLHAVAQTPFEFQVTGLPDLTGLEVRAKVRPYQDTISSIAYFKVTVDDAVNGVVTISLTREQTWFIPRTAFWDLQTMDSNKTVTTLVEGTFTTERQGAF